MTQQWSWVHINSSFNRQWQKHDTWVDKLIFVLFLLWHKLNFKHYFFFFQSGNKLQQLFCSSYPGRCNTGKTARWESFSWVKCIPYAICLLSSSAPTLFNLCWGRRRDWSKRYKKVSAVTLSLASMLPYALYCSLVYQAFVMLNVTHQKKKTEKANSSTGNRQGLRCLFSWVYLRLKTPYICATFR